MHQAAFRTRICSPDSLITLTRLARIVDCDRSVIERLLRERKITQDAEIENIGKGDGTSPLFRFNRASEVLNILAKESKQ
jgi:hypothetical protein